MSSDRVEVPCCPGGGAKMDLRIPSNGHEAHFKHPCDEALRNDNSPSNNGEDFAEGYELPLRTPDRRLMSSENTSLEVRKRHLPPPSPSSPDEEGLQCDSTDGKRRHVAKTLFGGEEEGKVGGSVTRRCLYGSPPQEQEDDLLKGFNAQIQDRYEQFMDRYQIVEEIDAHY